MDKFPIQMNKRVFLFFSLIILPIVLCYAQQGYFHNSNRLSSNLITRIAQDSSGFIWIGTENGLNKFDGWKYTHYFRNNKDSTSLVGNYVEAFLTDADGVFWIGLNRGLQYYCPYKDAFYNVEFPDNVFPSVRDIIQLHTGEIWVITAGYGVYSIDKHQMKATILRTINAMLGHLYAGRIFQDRTRQIWITLSNNQIGCISSDKKNIEKYSLPIDPRHRIHGIAEDNLGRIFIATSSNVFLWDNIRREFINLKDKEEESLNIRGITQLNDGTIYINTIGQGLKYVDKNSLKIHTPAKLPNGYNNPFRERITAFFEDNKGNFWLGCYKKGVFTELNSPTQFDFWDFSKIEQKGTLTSIYSDRGNNLWVGTEEGKLSQLDRQGNILSSFYLRAEISCMHEDANGTFWIGSRENGLSAFNRQTGTSTRLPLFEGKAVVAMEEDQKNNLYVSILEEGFMRYDSSMKKWFHIADTTQLSGPKHLYNKWIDDILCDSEGLIWLAQSTGVDCYDPERNIFLNFSGEEELRTCISMALMEDEKKNIWIGTNNGLFQYSKENNVMKHYGMEDGLPNNIIYGLGTDSEGNIWCSTLNGLFQLSYKDNRIAGYFSGNGLFDREYSRNVFLQDKDGYLYFGGTHGITRFMPDSIKAQSLYYHPILTNVYINNTPVSANTEIKGRPVADRQFIDASEIHLSYKEKIFSLEFSTMNFHNPENIVFEHRLLGMSEIWNSTFPGENRITYNFLSPGNYVLEIRAFENNTYSEIKSLAICITPPWYNTPWAIFFYILFFIGLLAGICYMYYKRQYRIQKERNNEEKLHFFINIAHELRSPITLIISPLSELISQKYDESTMKLLTTMQRNANRIVNLINQLLDIQRIDKGQMKITCEETDLVEFVRELFPMFDYQASKHNITFRFEPEVTHLPVWIDRNNFDKVLINLIGNAFKYTPDEGKITVSLSTPESGGTHTKLSKYAEIRISDSGPGINEKEIGLIFERFYQTSIHNTLGFGIGLNLTRMLVELHHGTIQATSRNDVQGSCFTVRIPLGREHLTHEDISIHSGRKRIALETPVYVDKKNNLVAIPKSKTRKKVLIVDDDDEVCTYLQKELAQVYKVATTSNGVEALQILLQQRLDLIILDVVMPEMDGFTLLKKIKSNNNISHIPVILLTSQVDFHSRMRGWDVGADGFLNKPFQIEELFLLCDNLIFNRSLLKGKFRGIKELEKKVNPLEIKSNDNLFMDRLMNMINQNLNNSSFSIETLAKEIGISRTQLHRKLKEMTGITTSDFIRNVRLKQAAKLLVEKKVNISQIAYATGFTNPTVFAVAFKKFYGCTPTEYAEKEAEEDPE